MSTGMERNIHRKPGRPPTGKNPMVGVRIHPELRKQIEAWAKAQPTKPNLSEAIRSLLHHALQN